MNDDDKEVLHLLIARLHARESANLAFLVISSSASLVFLGFIFDNNLDVKFWYIPIFGIIFPVFGLLYFEITSRTIHRHDHHQIRNLILGDIKEEKEKKRIKDIILYNKHRKKRSTFSRLLLFTPIFAWLVVTPFIVKNDFSTCLSIVGIVLSIIALCWSIFSDKLPDEDKDECKDD